MPAVMLDHEQPNQETGGRNSEQQADPVTEINAEPRRCPEQHEGSECDENLQEAAAGVRAAIARKNPRPARSLVRCRSRSRTIIHRHNRLFPSAAAGASLARPMLIWNPLDQCFH